MVLEFILVWMLGRVAGMGILFWILYIAWVVYRVLKEMMEQAPEMEE